MSRSERWVYPQGLIDPPGDIAAPPSPLRLYERGIWDPAEQYWREPDGMLEMCLVEVIAGGPRLQFEFKQILPGGEDLDAADPILDSIELRDSGQRARARALLKGLIEWDAPCLDAYAHLGALAFHEDDPAQAQAHYASGVRIAESSLPDGFGGVLGWGWVDNRPFLRCLHGLTLSLAHHLTPVVGAPTICACGPDITLSLGSGEALAQHAPATRRDQGVVRRPTPPATRRQTMTPA